LYRNVDRFFSFCPAFERSPPSPLPRPFGHFPVDSHTRGKLKNFRCHRVPGRPPCLVFFLCPGITVCKVISILGATSYPPPTPDLDFSPAPNSEVCRARTNFRLPPGKFLRHGLLSTSFFKYSEIISRRLTLVAEFGSRHLAPPFLRSPLSNETPCLESNSRDVFEFSPWMHLGTGHPNSSPRSVSVFFFWGAGFFPPLSQVFARGRDFLFLVRVLTPSAVVPLDLGRAEAAVIPGPFLGCLFPASPATDFFFLARFFFCAPHPASCPLPLLLPLFCRFLRGRFL